MKAVLSISPRLPGSDPTLPDNIEKDAGRGLYLMKTLSDDLIFEDGGSKVTMVFNL